MPVRAGKPAFIEGPIPDDINAEKFTSVCYNVNGEESKNGQFAKKHVYDTGAEKYYLKYGVTGLYRGKLMEPFGTEFNKGDEMKFIKGRGVEAYKYEQVSERSFNFYLEYLRSKNKSYYLNAERSR
jgi:hypothetical protein